MLFLELNIPWPILGYFLDFFPLDAFFFLALELEAWLTLLLLRLFMCLTPTAKLFGLAFGLLEILCSGLSGIKKESSSLLYSASALTLLDSWFLSLL
jgi:hypothetical protein